MLGPCIITREFMNQVKERGVDDAHIIFINRLLIRPCMQIFYIKTMVLRSIYISNVIPDP